MGNAAPPTRSVSCLHGDHDNCRHLAGPESISLWRLLVSRETASTLCACGCHADCPLGGRRSVAPTTWRQSCTCSGSDAARREGQQWQQRRRELEAVYAQARAEDLRDSAELETRLRAVFLARGEAPPPGLATGSRIAAAAQGAKGTRTVRLVRLAFLGGVRTVRWAWQPAVDDRDAANRAQSRAMFRAIGGATGLAAALTVGAALSSGPRRLLCGIGAAATWAVAAQGFTVGTAVTALARSVAQRSSSPDPP
jgi:hypothetical protein